MLPESLPRQENKSSYLKNTTALHEGSRYEHQLQQGAYNGIYPLPAAWTLQKSINTSRSGKANSMKFKLLIPKERK